jgi:hypothetical protein
MQAQWKGLLAICCILPLPVLAQDNAAAAKFAGMWSDPPPTIEGMACFGACTDEELESLYAMLDDPANDATPLPTLMARAKTLWREKNLVPLLTDFSRPSFPLDLDQSPAFLKCEPPGLSHQIFQPHQFRITVQDTVIQLQYGEWDAHRSVYLDGRTAPAGEPDTLYGFSTGHMDGDTLVVNTTHLKPDAFLALMNTSNQKSIEERYTLSADNQVLTMYATLTDPVALAEPVTLKKIRYWAPTETIDPYVDCNIPVDYIEHQGNLK